MDLKQARYNMIEQQIRPCNVHDRRVLAVLADIQREAFVDERWRNLAYSDFALPIGHGQSMFCPSLDGRLLQALQLHANERVLEIGTGSGCLSAALASLCAHVDSVESIPELSEAAAERLRQLGIDNVSLYHQSASELDIPNEHYDAIVFGGSLPVEPEAFKPCLRYGGRLFTVVGEAQQPIMEARLITRIDEHQYNRQSLFDTRLTALQNIHTERTRFVF